MRIILGHNYYRSSAPSGEDTVFQNELRLLETKGLEVIPFERFNDNIDDSTVGKRIHVALEYAWSRSTYEELSRMIRKAKPDLAHFHNIFPQISPSAYAACQDNGVPVVQTLHNYRFICPGALLMRNNHPCEICVGTTVLPALFYRCYRRSFAATGSLLYMIIYNRLRNTFTRQVNRYIALTEFAASRFVAGGLPADRIEIKPNFQPVILPMSQMRKKYAVYVGRLTEEKGLKTLLRAWPSVAGLSLKIIGDGLLRSELEQHVQKTGINVEFLGTKTRNEVLSVISEAFLQIVPSECYEGFSMAILEAYSRGTPVVASRIGSLKEIVKDKETGLLFETGNPCDLAHKINEMIGKPDFTSQLGVNAREILIEKYTSEPNFRKLMEIYENAYDDFKKQRKN